VSSRSTNKNYMAGKSQIWFFSSKQYIGAVAIKRYCVVSVFDCLPTFWLFSVGSRWPPTWSILSRTNRTTCRRFQSSLWTALHAQTNIKGRGVSNRDLITKLDLYQFSGEIEGVGLGEKLLLSRYLCEGKMYHIAPSPTTGVGFSY